MERDREVTQGHPEIQRRPIPIAEGCSAVMPDRPVDPNIEARKPREIPVGHYALKADAVVEIIQGAIEDIELL